MNLLVGNLEGNSEYLDSLADGAFLASSLRSHQCPALLVLHIYTNSKRLPVSKLLMTSTLVAAKPRAEPEPDSEHFDNL